MSDNNLDREDETPPGLLAAWAAVEEAAQGGAIQFGAHAAANWLLSAIERDELPAPTVEALLSGGVKLVWRVPRGKWKHQTAELHVAIAPRRVGEPLRVQIKALRTTLPNVPRWSPVCGRVYDVVREYLEALYPRAAVAQTEAETE